MNHSFASNLPVRRAFLLSMAIGLIAAACSGGSDDSVDASNDAGAADVSPDVSADVAADVTNDAMSMTDAQADTPVVTDAPIGVYGLGAEYIAEGGDYFDFTADGIPIFSFSRHTLHIANDSDASVHVDSVTMSIIAPAVEGEWRIIDPDNALVSSEPEAWPVENIEIPAGEDFSFDIYFYPFEMGEREAKVTITYSGGGGDGRTYAFVVSGRGRDNGVFFDHGANSWAQVWGHPSLDALSGAMVGDDEGNVYVSANVTEWLDGFATDLALARVNADGTLGWARVWYEDNRQDAPDPGQNGETGGGADSMDFGADGYLYLVGRRSVSSANSAYQTLIFKVDPETGDVMWSRLWLPIQDMEPTLGWHGSNGYGIDATLSDRVLVTGDGPGGMLLIALDKSDGSLIYSHAVDLNEGTVDRGYTVRADSDGNAYVAGLGNARGQLVRFVDADTDEPTLDWARRLDMGIGSNINSMDVDAEGSAYLSLDRRGARTYLSVARIDTDGSLAWAKTYHEGNTTDNNNTHVIRVDGDMVYVGGRISLRPFDTQNADGFLMRLDAADGAYDWGTFFYTGKGAEEIAQHRVKGIVVAGNSVRVLAQSYTGPINSDHYWGFWYNLTDDEMADPPGDGAVRLVDYVDLNPMDVTDDAVVTNIVDASAHSFDTSDVWVDPPPGVTYESARDRTGSGTDADVLIMNLVLE